MRGSFGNNVGFDLRVSKSRLKDMPLFVNEGNAPFGDRMDVTYDKVDILDISGELTYSLPGSLRLNGRVDVYTYDVRVQDEPWNLPPYKVALGASYDLRQKLIARMEVLFLGPRKGFRYSGDPDLVNDFTTSRHDLDGFMDLYLGLEYRYTKRLSLFVDVSNLSASKYEKWYQYPVQRTLFLGGATYSF
ncbi:MAG: TonB-dependent receptor [Flavobacteriales bacterium]|nr:TonB-dependent receptor [Flavobacteriales bacterium]